MLTLKSKYSEFISLCASKGACTGTGEAIEVTAVKNGAGDATNLVMTLIFVTP
jgi:hypothetical protein